MTSWSPVWEEIFSNRSWGKYPPEELVRFIARNFQNVPDRRSITILELGCGAGACSWCVAREGFSVCGIDGSPTAIRRTRERLSAEGLYGDFRVGDLTELPWPEGYFDGVIDVEALSCNTLQVSQRIVSEVHRVLKAGGLFFSITFKEGCWGDGLGRQIEPHTFEDISEGPCAGMGVIRFSPESEILKLYSSFEDLNVEYHLRSLDNRSHRVAEWIITCRKATEKH